jgi:hypothetical protein
MRHDDWFRKHPEVGAREIKTITLSVNLMPPFKIG